MLGGGDLPAGGVQDTLHALEDEDEPVAGIPLVVILWLAGLLLLGLVWITGPKPPDSD